MWSAQVRGQDPDCTDAGYSTEDKAVNLLRIAYVDNLVQNSSLLFILTALTKSLIHSDTAVSSTWLFITVSLTHPISHSSAHTKVKSNSKLYYDQLSAGKCVLTLGKQVGLMTTFLLISDSSEFFLEDHLSEKRMGL